MKLVRASSLRVVLNPGLVVPAILLNMIGLAAPDTVGLVVIVIVVVVSRVVATVVVVIPAIAAHGVDPLVATPVEVLVDGLFTSLEATDQGESISVGGGHHLVGQVEDFMVRKAHDELVNEIIRIVDGHLGVCRVGTNEEAT